MEILRADPADADALTEIAHAAKRHWGYPEHWIESWRDILTMRPQFIAENMTYCAKEDGAISRGVGRALFQHAVELAKKPGHHEIKIEAEPNAAGSYERMGAKRIGTSVTEIEGQVRELPLLLYTVSSERGEELAGQETSGTHT
jgi:GNAT superfamily N-acetyltransferase